MSKEIWRKGFTLIELLTVVAILGVIILIATPKFTSYTQDARIAQIKADTKTYGNMISSELSENPEFFGDWVEIPFSSIEVYRDEESLFSRKGLVKKSDSLGGKFFKIEDSEIGVNSKLRGLFIYNSGGEVYYREGTANLVADESNNGQNEIIASDPNYIWIENPNGYKAVGQAENGYYKYIGTDLETVEIPEVINGNPMTSYYNMFYKTGLGVKKVVSRNENITDMSQMFNQSKATSLDLSELNTSRVTNMSSMFSSATTTEILVENFNTSNVTNMSSMFYGSKATTLEIGNFNTSNVTNMSQMFSYSNASELSMTNFKTSNVTDMSKMFANSAALVLDVSKFDTGKVTNMNSMFSRSLAPVLEVGKFDTSSVTDMSSMFNFTKAEMLDISNFNTGKVTNMSSMFFTSKALELNVEKFDTSNVENMSSMFGTTAVTSLNISRLDTSKVVNMSSMFINSKVISLDFSNFNTSKVASMSKMFAGSKLIEVDLSKFDTSNTLDTSSMFASSSATKGWARTQVDSDKLNGSSGKPSTLVFQVK